MLHRKDSQGLIAVSQPSHAWVSGQLARHWGNQEFLNVPEEVCLAAEQHDIGFLDWERNPTLNPDTRLPYTFLEMPRQLHLEIWTASILQVLQFGRYPAMLVSMHYLWLLNRSRNSYPPEEQTLITAFRQEQQKLQEEMARSLRDDPYFGPAAAPEILTRNQQLVSSWDWMSLVLCHGLTQPTLVENIPVAHGIATLTFSPCPGDLSVAVAPWPFRLDRVRLLCEGRRLLPSYHDEAELRGWLAAASPMTLVIDLVPG